MTDIIKQLRECTSDEAHISQKAADVIATLRAANKRLQNLVEEAYCEGFDEGKYGGWIVGPSTPWKTSGARAALRGRK